ncbi:MAG TPA: tRNA (adenosine(37)-N6)-threonylcarbamoyltransferase complex dimerization subunit type 1 TsaB [Rubrivivax sp.]|nr:tRNA (adenosine(37)-N6)-threonylcarbamoyltransferase complex dimerization subunit type 1 TsaB [Rubrivivax sp.]
MPAQTVPNALPAAACVLALDTSTERLALGVHGAAGSFAVIADGGAAASATLLPQLHALLARARLTLADVDAIAFGRGPGAFTGLRTACAVAQGLGLGLGRPLLPIDSLLIVAEDARAQRAPEAAVFEAGVAMDARMDEVYAGRYRWQEGRWQVLQAPALMSLAALAEAWAGETAQVLAGSALAAFGPRLALPAGCPRVEREHDRAGALLRLALAGARAGEGVDAAAALPLYLRDKVALTTDEREAVRAAAVSA